MNLLLFTFTVWSCLRALATASPSTAEENEDDSFPFWPFPRNQSSVVSSATEPTDNPPQDLTTPVDPAIGANTAGQIPHKFIEKQCSAEQKENITQAWEDAKLLVHVQTTFRLGYEYNIPHTQWLGKD